MDKNEVYMKLSSQAQQLVYSFNLKRKSYFNSQNYVTPDLVVFQGRQILKREDEGFILYLKGCDNPIVAANILTAINGVPEVVYNRYKGGSWTLDGVLWHGERRFVKEIVVEQ